jgi:DNA repair exonuclease SbcCD ATPase subunit
MTKAAMFTFVLLVTVGAMSQTRQAPPPQASSAPILPATPQMAPPMDVHLSNLLTQLERAAQDANGALGRLRVDKWKANSSEKDQALANVQSLQRNLSYALPELTSKIRQAPQDLSANFKLYRNLNALYDVLANVAESAGAFGPKDQYEMLAQPVSSIDDARHQLGDRLDQLTAANQAELDRLRGQVQAIRQAEVTAPPKKIVIDDNTPTPKAKKPKAKKPATPPSQ